MSWFSEPPFLLMKARMGLYPSQQMKKRASAAQSVQVMIQMSAMMRRDASPPAPAFATGRPCRDEPGSLSPFAFQSFAVAAKTPP